MSWLSSLSPLGDMKQGGGVAIDCSCSIDGVHSTAWVSVLGTQLVLKCCKAPCYSPKEARYTQT